jgi:hypothetical protein
MLIIMGIIVADGAAHSQGMHNLPLIPAAMLATFGIWLTDMWRHRAHVHPKFARNPSAT